MSTPTYEAKKIGDRYELVPKVQPRPSQRQAWMFVGALLALAGLKRRGLLGLIALAAGIEIIYHSAAAHSPRERSATSLGQSGPPDEQRLAPSYHREHGGRAAQMPTDPVEEASMESFPASDAPGYTGAS